MLFKISLEDVGRNKATYSIEWSAASLSIAEKKALNEVKKHLMSSIITLNPMEAGEYAVCVGDFERVVGKVRIELLTLEEKEEGILA